MIGSKRLRERIRRIARTTAPAIEKALLEGAEEIASSARAFAPRDNGDLQASIGAGLGDPPATRATGALRSKKAGAGGIARASVWAGDDKAYYARWVEFGTAPHATQQGADLSRGKRQFVVSHPGSAPRPFFYSAYRLNRRRAINRVARAMRKAIRDAVT